MKNIVVKIITTLWIIASLLVLLVCWIRIGVLAEWRGDVLTVDANIGWIRVRIVPSKPKRAGSKKQKKKKAADSPEKQKMKFTWTDIKELLQILLPPLRRSSRRVRKGIRLHPFSLSLIVGAEHDPAKGAEQYGALQAGVWTFMPELERLLDIPEPSIHMDVDFTASQMKVEGTVGITARIGTSLLVVFTMIIPVLQWFLRWSKKNQQVPSSQPDTVEERTK